MPNTVVVIKVQSHPQKGESPETCKAKAESGQGAQAYDEFGTACWDVYGKAVIIGPDYHSIQEGFEIVNMNFHTQGNQPAVPNQRSLPGPSNDPGRDVQPPGRRGEPMDPQNPFGPWMGIES